MLCCCVASRMDCMEHYSRVSVTSVIHIITQENYVNLNRQVPGCNRSDNWRIRGNASSVPSLMLWGSFFIRLLRPLAVYSMIPAFGTGLALQNPRTQRLWAFQLYDD